jgi:uncharacterized UBP type Zn finger protein
MGRTTASHVTAYCDHFEPDLRVDAPLSFCAACLETGSTWVHLRQCLRCGRTGCCDLSPNRHATAHFHETGHPMIRNVQPDEDYWWWCYEDDRLYQSVSGSGMDAPHIEEQVGP